MVLAFAFICEVIRYAREKEFFLKNIYAVIFGIAIGCMIHPKVPDYMQIVYLNYILASFYKFTGVDLGFSGELGAMNLPSTIIANFAILFCLALVLRAAFLINKRMSLPSVVWGAVAGIYTLLAFYSTRFWHQAIPLSFIFLASYFGNFMKDPDWPKTLDRIRVFILVFFIAAPFFLAANSIRLARSLEFLAVRNSYYENAGSWMRKNIPEGETIYHSYWDDSSYFIYMNPKNNYINTNDPIYMFYRYPNEFSLIDKLCMGMVINPHEALGRIFKARYAYLRKDEPLYRQIKSDANRFRLLYEDNYGAIFELLKN